MLNPRLLGAINLTNLLLLGNVVVLTFAASLAPFAVLGQIPQLLSRLFPFTRGLNHAYWAPNVWAIVTFADRCLLHANSKLSLGWQVNLKGAASSSRGLVGDTVFAVLPDIKPPHTFLITVAVQTVRHSTILRLNIIINLANRSS
jgi:alpha-1,3-glucosyltransferase